MSDLKKIGAKITLDGEKEYKQALKDITSNQKLLRSEMKLAEAQYKASGGSMESMQQKSKVLTEQIDAQKDKIAVLKSALEAAKTEYGENSTQAQNWQLQLNYAETDLLSLNTALDANEQAMADAATAADNAGDMVDGFGGELSETEEESKGWGATLLENLSFTDIINIGKTALGAIKDFAKGVYDTVAEAAQYADDVLTESAQNGLSTDDIQVFKHASELIDTPTEAIEGAMTKITKAMDGARDGSKKYKDAFAAIGVQYTNDDGTLRNTSDVFWDTVDALGGMESGADRDSIAMDLFGKSAKELTGIINAGKKGFEGYATEAKAMGLVLSETQLTALGGTSDAIYRLDEAVKGFKLQLSAELAPAVNGILGFMTEVMMGATAAITGNKTELDQSIDDVVAKVNEAIKKFDAIEGDYETTTNQIDANVTQAGKLADTIFDLAGKTELTQDEEFKLYGALYAINKLIPGLNLEYDKQTGALNKTRTEVDSLTDAYKKQALEAAISAKGSSLVAAYAELYMGKIAAEREISKTVAEYGDEAYDVFSSRANAKLSEGLTYAESIKSAYDDLYSELEDEAAQQLAYQVDQTKNAQYENIRDALLSWDAASVKLDEAETAMQEFNETAAQAREEMGLAVEDIDLLGDASEQTGEQVSAATAEIDEETASLTALQKELKAYADASGQTLEAVEQHFSDLADAYASAYQAAEASINGQTGLFSKLEADENTHLENIVDNLQGQNAILEDWTANVAILQQAVNEGILDQGLVNQLVEAGPQMAMAVGEIASAVTNGNDVAITRLNEAYQKQIDIKTGFAETMAEAQTGFNAYAESIGLSADVVADELSARGVTAGQVYGEGLTAGLEATASVDDSAEDIIAKAEANAEAYQTAGASAGANYTSGMQTELETAKGTMDATLTEIETRFDTSKTVISDYGTSAGTDFMAYLTAQLNAEDAQAGLDGALEVITTKVSDAADGIAEDGTSSGTDYLSNMIAALSDAQILDGDRGSVQERLINISTKFDAAKKQITAYGTDAADGFINKLINKISDRLPEVQAAAASVAASVKAALEIGSPSKVMARLGGFAADGLTLGFADAVEDSLPEIAASMAGLTDVISGNLSDFTMRDNPIVTVQAPSTDLAGVRADIGALAEAISGMQVVLNDRTLVGRIDTEMAQRKAAYSRRN